MVQVISKKQQDINISIGGTKLLQVEKFVYLGGTITQSGKCTEDIKNRIGKALGAVQSLHSILTAKDIRDVTKLQLYKVLILSILMYGSETCMDTEKRRREQAPYLRNDLPPKKSWG